jgi:hypothetical protein
MPESGGGNKRRNKINQKNNGKKRRVSVFPKPATGVFAFIPTLSLPPVVCCFCRCHVPATLPLSRSLSLFVRSYLPSAPCICCADIGHCVSFSFPSHRCAILRASSACFLCVRFGVSSYCIVFRLVHHPPISLATLWIPTSTWVVRLV